MCQCRFINSNKYAILMGDAVDRLDSAFVGSQAMGSLHSFHLIVRQTILPSKNKLIKKKNPHKNRNKRRLLNVPLHLNP